MVDRNSTRDLVRLGFATGMSLVMTGDTSMRWLRFHARLNSKPPPQQQQQPPHNISKTKCLLITLTSTLSLLVIPPAAPVGSTKSNEGINGAVEIGGIGGEEGRGSGGDGGGEGSTVTTQTGAAHKVTPAPAARKLSSK